MNDDKSHHVAWADRVGYNKLWFQDIQACSVAFGTEYYPNAVWRLYYDIVNIKKGPQLKDEINDYLKKEFYPQVEKMVVERFKNDPNLNYDFERTDAENLLMPEFCSYMKQLLEDNGFGFYESNIDEDEML